MRNGSGVPFGKRRGEAWSYRREVPDDVRTAIGKTEWTKGLGRVSKSEARLKCAQLAADHEKLIERARAGEITVDPPADIPAVEREARALLKLPDEHYAGVMSSYEMDALMRAAEAHGGDLRAVERLYGDRAAVLAKFGAPHAKALVNALDNGGRYVPDRVTLRDVYNRDVKLYGGDDRDERPARAALDSFEATAGAALDVREIRKDHAIEWLAYCRRRGWKDSTIRRRAEPLAAMVNRWLKDHDIFKFNPFSQLGLSGGAATDRVPFNKGHLEKIEAFLKTDKAPTRTRQIMRIMKGTGGGPSEIGGLEPADVILDAEIPHIWIRPNSTRGLKTKSRERRIPLVADALQAATEVMRKPAGQGVFYEQGKFNRGTLSAVLNLALRAAEIPRSPRLSCYSFRHGLAQALRQAGAREDLARYLMGHTGHDIHHRYGAPAPLLREARDALSGAMGMLGEIDPSIYSPEELA